MEKELILITGSCGRIGSQIVRRLASRYQMIGFELSKSLCRAPHLDLISVDLSSDESVQKAFQQIRATYGKRIASVIHLAAYYSFEKKYSPLYEKVTVQGTERLLKALSDFEVEQFLFSSTMLVHAPTQPGRPITENHSLFPKWDYPLSKVKTERLIHRLKGNMKTVILRISGVYDDHCHSIPISHQIQRIYEKKIESHFFSGDINHGAAFLHMEDLIDAMDLAVRYRHQLPSELTLLLGEGQTLSYRQLQEMISQLLWGKPIRTFCIPKFLAKLGAWLQGHTPFIPKPFIKPWMIDLADDHYELDCSRAKEILGWMPKHSLEQTLPKMIQELKADPAAWYKTNQLSF